MIHAIVNENAGDAPPGEGRAAQVQQLCADADLEAKVLTPRDDETLEQVAQRALDAGAQTLVAVGGDGTIAALAGVCHDADARLGIIPSGTFNYFARAHGIPQDAARAIEVLKTAPVRDIALGRVGEQVFLNNVSVGLYPTILREREDVYGRFGRSRAAAYWSVIKALATRPKSLHLRITLDGTAHDMRTMLTFVAASAYQLREFHLDGTQALEDGGFAMLTAPQDTRAALLRAAWRITRGKAVNGPDYQMRQARDIVIAPRQSRILVACDGEKRQMDTPLHISRHARPLRLIAPREDK